MIITIFYLILCISGLALISSMYLISYIKNKNFHLNKFNENYAPKCAVFVPCKHFFYDLKKNLESVLNQNYKGEYRTIFIIESENDESFTVVRDIVSNNKNAEYIIVGTAKRNGQKNHGILKAIEKIENENIGIEAYVFFDSDHFIPEESLTTLIQTLTINDTEISTLHSHKKPRSIIPLGNTLYAMLNNYIYGFNTVSNQAWGGSLAMRKETYKKYKIDEIWPEALSHDCPINGLGAKILFNPNCTPEEERFFYTTASFIKWTKRQFTNWRLFSPKFWCLSFFSILANLFVIYSFLFVLIENIIRKNFGLLLVVLSSYIVLSHIVLSLFLSFKMKNKVFWIIMHIFLIPVFLNALFISFSMSIFNNKIVWAGKKYIIGKNGKVLEIINLETNEILLKN